MFASRPVRPSGASRPTGGLGVAGLGSGDVSSRGTVQERRALAGQMADLLPERDGYGEAGKTAIRGAGV